MISIPIKKQPDETTCGPTSLHSLYEFYDDSISLETVINEVIQFDEGGTVGALLAVHALKRGYKATIYTYNLQVFDPSWFELHPAGMIEKLLAQKKAKKRKKLSVVTNAYIEFLKLGGELKFQDLKPSLLRKHLKKGHPILAGLSATYLYQTKREYEPNSDYDDINGHPAGHFVLLSGYDPETREVQIADPISHNPLGEGLVYRMNIDRVINAILLGIVTYDANLIIITPAEK
ncbi:C39 family peptidase [Rhodohalobacter halophilus]|uniref:C39 family peptidase n=1 Tax=Rhodohalobacter halophilus TaxID=1812810 RepID=UPI00083FD242|nr:C39 family peptidase [Rhodohalobacter halophilus]